MIADGTLLLSRGRLPLAGRRESSGSAATLCRALCAGNGARFDFAA
jgi:hypothetical protein